MKSVVYYIALLIGGIIVFPCLINAQTADQVRLFQDFYRDGAIQKGSFGEAEFDYGFDDDYDLTQLTAKGGLPLLPDLALDGRVGFRSLNPDKGNRETGLTDLLLSLRQGILSRSTKLSAGGYLTLPIGDEDVGQNHFNLGAFGAVRHPLAVEGMDGLVLTGTAGIDFVEVPDDKGKDNREISLVLGAGLIYPLTRTAHLISEILLKSEEDYAVLSLGGDFNLGNGHLRSSLGLGMDDRVPDIQLSISFLLPF